MFPAVRSVCVKQSGHMYGRLFSTYCMHTRTIHTSSHVSKKEEPLRIRLLRFVGWLGGFYARKQVSVV